MDKWKDYKCFKVCRDAEGNFMPKPKYVSFRGNVLCGYYDTETEAGLGYLKGESLGVRLADFEGIDGRMK